MELSEALGVTVVTIRRDLNELEDGNYLKREHGYAIVVDEDDIESRMLFIEGGSTNALLARLLTKRDDITIITMSTYISNLLKDSPCNVILLGGMLQKHSEAMVGPITRASLQLVHFSKAFIGIDGYTPETGFTGRDMMRTDTLNCVLQKSPYNIILTDSSKFGRIFPNALSPMELIHQVITDHELPAIHKDALSTKVELTLI